MKLSSLALATTLALALTGCALDSALNSVTSTIDSITTPSGTTNKSTNSKMETKNLATVTQLENFCKNSPDGVPFIITALPDLKRGQFAGSVAEILFVSNSKNEITIEAENSDNYINYGMKAFSPSEYDPYKPNEKVKLIRPMEFHKSMGFGGGTCKLKYHGF
ncbi:hypothetical protein [uncultured Campylobacter sp.]|uniref:hypothetical protein n=1 Tax=uncultured Campylobacter sp. TaxID=218934 RepID=UPI0026193FCB|nr:hypothetical protein [uncultured Campylobacter sp.]